MRRSIARLAAVLAAALVVAGSAAAADRTTHTSGGGPTVDAVWSDFDPSQPEGTVFTTIDVFARDQTSRTDGVRDQVREVTVDITRSFISGADEVIVSHAGWRGTGPLVVGTKLATASVTADDLPLGVCEGPAGYCAGLGAIDVRAAFTAISPLLRDIDNFRFADETVNFVAHSHGTLRIVTGQGTIDDVPIAVPFSGGVITDGFAHDVEVCRGPSC